MALGVEQARHTHPPSARPRPLNGRQEHQEDSSWLHSSGLRPASAGGAGCPGCGRLLQPPPWDGVGQHPKTAPGGTYSTASQPLPPPQGLYYRPYCAASYWQPGGRAPRAPRRAQSSQSSNEYCRLAASQGCRAAILASQGAHRLLWLWPASGTTAGGRCTRAFPHRRRRRRARPTLLAHGTRRHPAAENRRCSARSARDLVLSRLDPAIPRVYL